MRILIVFFAVQNSSRVQLISIWVIRSSLCKFIFGWVWCTPGRIIFNPCTGLDSMIFSVLFGPQLSFSISFQCLQIFLISLEKLFISLSYLLYYQSLAEGDCVVRCKCCRITDCSVRSSRLMVKCGTCADCQHLRGRLRMPPQRGEASVAMPLATLLSRWPPTRGTPLRLIWEVTASSSPYGSGLFGGGLCSFVQSYFMR